MKKPNDAGARAAEFLKAWQAQMARQMHDPDTIRAMISALQAFGGPRHDEPAKQPAPADDAEPDDAVRKLERRLDAVERKLAALSRSLRPVSVAAKAKKPDGTGKRRNDGHVEPGKRGVAAKAKPVRKKR